ncbi:MAG: hypothetical protein ACREFZ_00500 [Acetobacteraceae bacterium]
MKRLFLVAASLLLAPLSANAANYTTWGTETWACGDSTFTIQLGSGPAYIDSIYGTVSASNLPGASDSNGWVRQSLLAISAGVGTDANVTYTQPGGNNEVDGNLLAINLKQVGWESHEVPVFVTFRTPVEVPSGELSAVYNTQTYDGSESVSDDPVECLDTEAHLTIIWGPAP